MNQSTKSLGQIGGSMCGEELLKELQPSVSWLVGKGFVLMQDNDPKHINKLS